jgi:phosphopantetheinyl transferase
VILQFSHAELLSNIKTAPANLLQFEKKNQGKPFLFNKAGYLLE